MRIDRLYIPNYKNLHSFEINFDETQATTVLLGRNGSGKSNLIEAIVEIFRELESGGQPPFAYIIDYVCRDYLISIDADPSRPTKRMTILVNGKRVPLKAFNEKISEYLPNYVFAYYSGWSSRLERHFDRPTRKHYNAVLNSKDNKLPLRRMFFCRREYSQLVLLAFFLSTTQSARSLLEGHLGIKRFDSALFVLKTPYWRDGGAPNHTQLKEGDPRFWYARGAFKGLLDRLWRTALAPIRNIDSVERDIRKQAEKNERLYLFIKNEDDLADLKEANDDPKDLFGYLESLFLCDLIDEVRVTVEKTDGTRVKFTQMSEGEQQLLTVIGLLLFTLNDESLYLLDEPDTHLNPVWTYEFLKLIQENIRADKGQLVIATHNPLMIGTLHRNQVRIIEKDIDENNIITSVAREPEYDPIGIGVEGLLKSEIYGLRSTLAPELVEKLDRHYFLLGRNPRTSDEQNELRKIAVELNSLGVSRTHPNPYFELFASAMARRVQQDELVLSKDDIEAQTKLANEILAELLDEKDGEEG